MPRAVTRPAARSAGLLALVLLAALPSGARALDYDEARHLLARTGFGATDAEIRDLAPLSHAQAVRRLLREARRAPVSAPPAWTDEAPRPRIRPRLMSTAQRKALRETARDQAMALKAWWYWEMIATPSPLTERMTLFWHNHFTSSLRKVRSPHLIYRQNALLRRHALGNFRELLHAVARDPAMIIYLDNATNRLGKPNENFARELLELFTLGEGQGYGEQDVKEAARAFTGWGIDPWSGEYVFRPGLHDDGVKTFLGRTGRWNGDDIIDILLDHPRVAVHITEKLWRELVSETPDPDAVARTAGRFRASGYDIKVALEAILLSPEFRDPAVRGTLIKSPVELLVGTVRTFRLPLRRRGALLPLIGRRLGQDLMNPPNVKGWPGGGAWITADSLLARRQIMERLTRPAMLACADADPAPATAAPGALDRWLDRQQAGGQTAPALAALLLPVAAVDPIPAEACPAEALRRILLDPAYQLK